MVVATRDAILAAAASEEATSDVYLCCPAHPDTKESLCVRAKGGRRALVYCHAHCETDEVLTACGLTTADMFGENDRGERPAPLSERLVHGWARELRDDLPRLRWLREHRGLNRQSVIVNELGWDGRHYIIPIRDADGELVNVRRYNRDKTPKILNLTGHGSPARLYPLDVLDRHDDVVLCESELDALLLNQHGIPAVTGTGGARMFRPEWAEQFHGKVVRIAYDCDADGRVGAQKAARHLDGYAKAVHVADLGLGDKEDVTDWFVRYDKTAEDLRRLLTAAPHWDEASAPSLTTWGAVNIGAILRGEALDQPPTMLRRTDGVALLYPAKVHAFNSEPEAGKTWLALHICAERLLSGEHVLFIDFEDSAEGVVGRVVAMGVPKAAIEMGFHYVRPDEPLNGDAEEELFRLLTTYTPTVAILDGVTEAMVLHGWSIKDNDDAARFMKTLTRPIAGTGAAVVVLDHVTKDREGRGRHAIGAQHKLAGIDGAVYTLEPSQAHPFGRGMTGRTVISVAKDRPGHVRPQAEGKRVGTFVMESNKDGSVTTRVDPAGPPGHVQPGSDADVPESLLVEISTLLEKAGERLSTAAIKKSVGGNAMRINFALNWLVISGAASRHEEGPGKPTWYAHVRPYVPEEGASDEG